MVIRTDIMPETSDNFTEHGLAITKFHNVHILLNILNRLFVNNKNDPKAFDSFAGFHDILNNIYVHVRV